jgi:hypothetical protein
MSEQMENETEERTRKMNWRDVKVPTAAETRERVSELRAGGASPAAARRAAMGEARAAGFAREEPFLAQEHGAGPIDPRAAAWLAER